MNKFFVSALLFSFVSVSASAAEMPATWLTPDFAISQAPAHWQKTKAPQSILPADPDPRSLCESRVRQALCLTSRNSQEIVDNWSRVKCQEGSEDFVETAMALYDEMPEKVRPLYCSLERIFLSDGIPSVAFASVVQKNHKVVGAFVGARKSSFGGSVQAKDLISWKEQLLFGGSENFLSNDPSLVQISYNFRTRHTRSDGLYYVMMHELGHIVDFQNDINYNPPQSGWAPLSWASGRSPTREARFQFQDRLCYYNCPRHLKPSQANELYSSLRESAFITTYSGASPLEDFAEFWAWHILREFHQPDFRVALPGQGEIDMNPVFTENPKVVRKMDLIRKLWDSPDTKIGFPR